MHLIFIIKHSQKYTLLLRVYILPIYNFEIIFLGVNNRKLFQNLPIQLGRLGGILLRFKVIRSRDARVSTACYAMQYSNTQGY